MISVHRVYEIKDISHNHAHIEINPVGVIDIEIVEKKEHHRAEFKDLSFKPLTFLHKEAKKEFLM